MNTYRWLVLAALFVSLAACSGGSAAPPAVQTAALSGTVEAIDGNSGDRSGVVVRVLETGDIALTDALGRFRFEGLPLDEVTLVFEDPNALILDMWTFEDLIAGMEVDVRCSLREGQIEEFDWIFNAITFSEVRFFPGPASPRPEVEGRVAVEVDDEGERLLFEASGLSEGEEVEFFLDDFDLTTGFESIGTASANAEGVAQLVFDTAQGDTLPLGAQSVRDLIGFGVEVRLVATGETILVGFTPGEVSVPLPPGDPGDPSDPGLPYGRAQLTSHVAGVEGAIDVGAGAPNALDLLLIVVYGLEPDDNIALLIDDGAGGFTRFGTATANSDGLVLFTDTSWLADLGFENIKATGGLEIRIVRDDSSEELLLSGTIPTLD